MSTQYTFNSKTQSGTITIDNRFITIQRSNFLFGIFRIRKQNQTLPLQTLSLVSSGLRYRRNSISQGAFFLLLSVLTTTLTLCFVAIIYFLLAVFIYGHSFSSSKLNPPGIKYIILISLAFYILIQLFISTTGYTTLHLILFSLGIMILMKSLQATLSIQQFGTQPVILGIDSRDISIVQDIEKSIISSLTYNINKTDLNTFFDHKH